VREQAAPVMLWLALNASLGEHLLHCLFQALPIAAWHSVTRISVAPLTG
jgi:hypothetical protein